MLSRRHAGDGPESTRKGTVISKATVERNLGDISISFTQQAAADGDTSFGDQLHGADAVDAFDDAGKACRRHASLSGK